MKIKRDICFLLLYKIDFNVLPMIDHQLLTILHVHIKKNLHLLASYKYIILLL
jgi:hypothetical protein